MLSPAEDEMKRPFPVSSLSRHFVIGTEPLSVSLKNLELNLS